MARRRWWGVAAVAALAAVAAGAGPALADGRAWTNVGDADAEVVWAGTRAAPRAITLRVRTGEARAVYRGLQAGGWRVAADGSPLVQRDLDRDGTFETIVDLEARGTRPVRRTHIVAWRADEGRHRRVVHDWGAAGYTLRDLDRDGRPEFVSFDDRLGFGAPPSTARMPVRIWAYRDGALRDVTREHPARVRADLNGHWRAIAALPASVPARRDAVAAYLASARLLDRGAPARTRLASRLRRPADARFLAVLERRLDSLGYTTLSSAQERQ